MPILRIHLLFHPFILSQCLFLSVRCVSYRQQIIESCFLNQLTILCLVMGELRPLTFSVDIERYVAILATLLLLCVHVYVCVYLILSYSSFTYLLVPWDLIVLMLSSLCLFHLLCIRFLWVSSGVLV
jgi:hypothetical protein